METTIVPLTGILLIMSFLSSDPRTFPRTVVHHAVSADKGSGMDKDRPSDKGRPNKDKGPRPTTPPPIGPLPK